jgi:hypothetical protein
MQTPANTASEVMIESDSEPVRSTQRHPQRKSGPRRARQQPLDFTNARHRETFDAPVKLPASNIGTRPLRKKKKVGVFSSGASKLVELSSEESAGGSGASSIAKLKKSKKGKNKAQSGGKGGDEGERITRSSRRNGTPRKPMVVDSDDEITISNRVASQQSASEDEVVPVIIAQQTESDEDDEMPSTLGTQSRKRRRHSSSPPPSAPDSDSDVVEIVKPRKRRRHDSSADEDEDEDVLPKTPRRLKQARHLSQKEKEELAEDLDFLGPSSDRESGPPRSTQSAEKDARLRALEKLKQKRGKPLPQVDEEEEDEGEEEEEEDAEDGEGTEEEDELLDDDEEALAPPMSSRQFFREEKEDEDFLVEEEEEGPLGVPTGIPLQFTRYASMKSKELFRFAIDWMVQKKINPAFQLDDEIYRLTFQKLDDEVRGLAGSKFTSSAWVPPFTIALQARPEIAYHRFDRNAGAPWERDKCDACNRSSHPATYEVQFQGKPYDWNTLEQVESDEDESGESSDDDDDGSDEENADHSDYDAKGRQVLPESTIWYLGKFCMANAVTAHSLSHWKYHLYEAVHEWLERKGYLHATEVVKRDKLSTRKRRKRANKIVDQMEDQGMVKELWRNFRDSIDKARDSKQGRYGGESP